METLVSILLRYAAEGDADMVGVYVSILDASLLTDAQLADLAAVGVEL